MSKLSHNGPVEETHHISRMLYLLFIKKKKIIQTNINADMPCLSSELEKYRYVDMT